MLCFLRSPLSPCLCSRVIVFRFSKRLCLLHAFKQHLYLCCLLRCCLLQGLAPSFLSAAFQVQCLLCLSHSFFFFFPQDLKCILASLLRRLLCIWQDALFHVFSLVILVNHYSAVFTSYLFPFSYHYIYSQHDIATLPSLIIMLCVILIGFVALYSAIFWDFYIFAFSKSRTSFFLLILE